MKNYFSQIVKIIFVIIFLIIAKENVLLNEEIILISIVTLFIYAFYNIITIFLNSQLENKQNSIFQNFSRIYHNQVNVLNYTLTVLFATFDFKDIPIFILESFIQIFKTEFNNNKHIQKINNYVQTVGFICINEQNVNEHFIEKFKIQKFVNNF
jgi:hypothetical protein